MSLKGKNENISVRFRASVSASKSINRFSVLFFLSSVCFVGHVRTMDELWSNHFAFLFWFSWVFGFYSPGPATFVVILVPDNNNNNRKPQAIISMEKQRT